MSIVSIILAVLLLAGLALFLRGLRGRQVRRFLWRATVAVCIVAWIATLGIGAGSYRWQRQWDLSVDGERWRFVHLGEGCVTVSYAARAEPPLLPAQDPVRVDLQMGREMVRLHHVLERVAEAQRARIPELQRVHETSAANAIDIHISGRPTVERKQLCQRCAETLQETRRRVNDVVFGQVHNGATFGFFIHVARSPVLEFVVRLPLWPLLIVCGIAPMIAWRRRRVRIRAERRRRGNRCVGCDYDLTGNVSGVCPECGKPI